VAIYEYRCERDGAFDLKLPIGTAPATVACPECASAARRVFSSPMVSFAPRALVAALDHEDKTRTEPDVVTSLPRKPAHQRTPVVPLTPTLARLPRPKY
jgi:putative FmdB family regulatory protein